MKRNEKGMFPSFLPLLVFLGVFGLIYYFTIASKPVETINYSIFEQELAADGFADIEIEQNKETPTGNLKILRRTGDRCILPVSDVAVIEQELKEKFPGYRIADVKKDSVLMQYVLPAVIFALTIYIIFTLMSSQAGPTGMMNFGKNHAIMTINDVKTRFTDVAGLAEEKEELEEIVDFLKNPRKYLEIGARIPKGVLLEGPPGTGKTLLAKAVAGEAGVPFFSISGSDFVEMFVGVGASRVRSLFADAKQAAPCIVFIDEIDAVARRRGTGMGGGHDEREQTLNQMLVEMDGFELKDQIIVLAATNRVDILDPAILRPGRFDRKVTVGAPDVKGRREILEVHAKNKPLSEDVDLEQIARTSSGFTGADLENLLNEAAIMAARANRKYICMSDIRTAFVKVGVGPEKRSKVITEKDKEITAYHEAGHAILFHVLEGMGPVYIISIIPTGPGALGYTMPLPENDDVHMTRGKMLNTIMVSLGGRIAEQLTFDDYTSGASQDIKQATSVARNMVMKYGMSERLGMINYANENDEVFIGRDFAHTKNISDSTASLIDEEVRNIMSECYDRAKAILTEHQDILKQCAEYLLENEKMDREAFEALF